MRDKNQELIAIKKVVFNENNLDKDGTQLLDLVLQSYSKLKEQPRKNTLKRINQVQKTAEYRRFLKEPDHSSEHTEFYESENNGYAEITTKRIKTLEDLIEAIEIDLEKWRITSSVIKKSEMGYKDSEGNAQVEQLYHLRVNLSPDDEKRDLEWFESNIIPKLNKLKVKEFKPLKSINDGLILEIPFHDFHLGKRVYKEETNQEYDLDIAEKTYYKTIETLIQRAPNYNYKQVMLVIGSDFFNSDSMFNTTTSGTPQDEDNRWHKTFSLGCEIVINAVMLIIEQLKCHVEIIVVPGNHDRQRSFYLGKTLEYYFKKNHNVTVDNSVRRRKYRAWGNNAVMITHGDKINQKDWNDIFASEEPEIWGKSKNREVHSGDKHHLSKKKNSVHINEHDYVKELKGCVFRITRSVSSTDDWHHSAGYIGTIRGTEAFVWHPESGIINIINANI